MLNISSATVSNGGDYTCNVTNNAGFSSNTTTVYSELIKLLLNDHHLKSTYLSLSTVVLNSRDRYEKLWLLEFSHF